MFNTLFCTKFLINRMQANKKTGASSLLLFFVLLGIGSSLIIWQFSGKSPNWFKWGKPDPLSQAMELIQTRYVDAVSLDTLKGLGLKELALKLDPHSAYLEPNKLLVANEELSGHFAGIGIEFNQIRDTVTVAYLMPNSPGVKAGLMTGDQLLAVNGRSLVGANLSFDSIRSIVRGPNGSAARLTIRRQGAIRSVSIVRAEIPTPAVTNHFMLDDTTGYLQLSKFSEGSYRESVKALEELLQKGMRSLILDLRSNGGGYLQEAVELADEFLADERLIVYTEGAHSKKRSYSCKRPGLFEKGNLILLTNEFSASASEVLAGALQDWCRATIVGRRSFGKGLVQEQYELSNNGALRLTVARYYTPLGRCIQRPYTGDRLAYLNDTMAHPKATPSGGFFLSTCGDTLYVGGGIQPDIYIPKSSLGLSPAGLKIFNTPEIIQWAYQYYMNRKKEIDGQTDLSQLALTPPVAEIQQFFRNHVTSGDFQPEKITENDWKRIGFEMYAQIARFRNGPHAFTRIQQLQDSFMIAALSLLRNRINPSLP